MKPKRLDKEGWVGPGGGGVKYRDFSVTEKRLILSFEHFKQKRPLPALRMFKYD